MRVLIGLAGALLLAGCGEGSVVPVTRPAPIVPVPNVAPGPVNLTQLYGVDARALNLRFGQPQLDVQEGTAHKLQYGSATCVLDAYLYPKEGRGEPVVTHIDARQRNGAPIDPASCVAALTKRPPAP